MSLGPDIRRGLTELNGEGEAPGGIVIMRYGENALHVIDGVKARLAEIRAGLPDGVEIVTTYDRSRLIRASVSTLARTLIEEMIVVSARHLPVPAPRAQRADPDPDACRSACCSRSSRWPTST